MSTEKTVRGLRFIKLDNGHIQVYARQRSRQLAAIGIKHSAWRLAFEASPALIKDLYDFMSAEPPSLPASPVTPAAELLKADA